MRLSDKRRRAIFGAVHAEIMTMRIELAKSGMVNDKVDFLIAQAGSRAGEAAIKAAEGSNHDQL